jgi:hypothetical protein
MPCSPRRRGVAEKSNVSNRPFFLEFPARDVAQHPPSTDLAARLKTRGRSLITPFALTVLTAPPAAAGVAIALLVVEHALVRADDLSRVGVAFFTVNGVIALLVGAAGVVDVFV